MKQVQTILGVKIQSESAEQRFAMHVEFQSNRYDDCALLEDDFESLDQIMADLVH